MARTLSSLQRMARISTIEVDIEVNFEEGPNIFFQGILFFFVWTGVCFNCMSSYLSSLFLLCQPIMDTLLYKSIHSIFCCCFKYLEKPCSSEIKLCYQRLFFQQMVTIEYYVITPNYSGQRKTLSTAYLVSCGPPFISSLKADQTQRILFRIFKCKEVTS